MRKKEAKCLFVKGLWLITTIRITTAQLLVKLPEMTITTIAPTNATAEAAAVQHNYHAGETPEE